jgi:hypothetical protein
MAVEANIDRMFGGLFCRQILFGGGLGETLIIFLKKRVFEKYSAIIS